MKEEELLLGGVNRVERGASLLDEIAAELAVEEDSASGGRGGEETPLKVKLQRMLQEEEGSNSSPAAAYLSPSDDRRKGAVFAQDLGSLFASGFGLLGDGAVGSQDQLTAGGVRRAREEEEIQSLIHTRATPSPLSRVEEGSLFVWAGTWNVANAHPPTSVLEWLQWTGEPEPRVEARGCSDVRDKDAVLVYGVSEGEEVLASGAGGKSEGGDGRSGSAAHEETKGGAAQDMSDSDKIAAAMEKNMPMHMQWLGLSEGESGTTPEDSDFASAGNAATKALEEVGQTCGGEGADKFGEDGFVGDGDRRRAHQTPLPDIYAVGLQEVDTSVGAAMFTAFETRRAKEWEDVIANRSMHHVYIPGSLRQLHQQHTAAAPKTGASSSREEDKPRDADDHMGCANDSNGYVKVLSKQMGAIWITVHAREHVAAEISEVSAAAVSVGVLGVMGNKGAVAACHRDDTPPSTPLWPSSHSVHPFEACAVRFRIRGQAVCFVAAHLNAGDGEAKYERRIADVADIRAKMVFHDCLQRVPSLVSRKGKTSKAGREGAEAKGQDASIDLIQFHPPIDLKHHDKVVFLGDLNFRLRCPAQEARQWAKEPSKLRALAQTDELYKAMASGQVLRGFDEGRLKFPPTYKYDVGTDRYDTSHKARIPAWTDRILWRGSRVLLLTYGAEARIKTSDHRPVYAVLAFAFGSDDCPRPHDESLCGLRRARAGEQKQRADDSGMESDRGTGTRSPMQVGVLSSDARGGEQEEVLAEPYQLLPQRRSVLLSDLEGSLNSLGDSFKSSADLSAEVVGSLFSQVGRATFGESLALNSGALTASTMQGRATVDDKQSKGRIPHEISTKNYADLATTCLDLVLDIEGLQWAPDMESGGVSISRLRDTGAGAGGLENVLRATLRVAAGERAVARVLWDWSKRTAWDKSCEECRHLFKFDSHHSILEMSHFHIESTAAEGAGAVDASGRTVSFQVLQSRRLLPPSPVAEGKRCSVTLEEDAGFEHVDGCAASQESTAGGATVILLQSVTLQDGVLSVAGRRGEQEDGESSESCVETFAGPDVWLRYQAIILSKADDPIVGVDATDVAVYLSVGGRAQGRLHDLAVAMLQSLQHVEAVVLESIAQK